MAANSANGFFTRLWAQATASKSENAAEKPKVSTHGFFATEYVVDMATGEMKRAPLGVVGRIAVAALGAGLAFLIPMIWDDEPVTLVSALVALALAAFGVVDPGDLNTKIESGLERWWERIKSGVGSGRSSTPRTDQ